MSADNFSTDPRWDAKAGGLPESKTGVVPDWLNDIINDACRHVLGEAWTPQTATDETVDPPRPEPLSPFQRAELERIARDMEAALAELRAFLRRS